MRNKVLAVLAALAVIVAAGLLAGFLAGRGPAPKTPIATDNPDVWSSSTGNITSFPAVRTQHVRGPSLPAQQPGTDILAGASPPASSDLITNWEDRVDDILGSDAEDADKIKQLFALFPRLPVEGQVEVAQHLSNLVPDDNYAPLGKLLVDPKQPEAVLDVLVGDVLNRPNSLKLPLLLQVAQDPSHAKAGEAKDLLALYLGDDYGTDWKTWQQKLSDWLKENPD